MNLDAPRVMLLAPQFWTSGTVTFAREMQLGWPPEWPRPPIVCPTKSGRPSSLWGRSIDQIKRTTATTWEPDVTGTVDDVIRMAHEQFDLVYVTDPDIPRAHREWWYQLLERLPIPWTLTFNGNKYPDVQWNRIITAKKFSGVVWRTPGDVPPELCDNGITFVSLPRPYTMKYARNAHLLRVQHPIFHDVTIVGTHGCVAPTKGTASTLALSKHVGAHICLDGVLQAGAVLYATTIRQCYLDETDTTSSEISWVSSSSKIAPGHVCYNGAFTYGIKTARHHDVHVSTTHREHSAGHEYALLEAIDAGCVIVQPKHMTEPQCKLIQHVYPYKSQGVINALKYEHTELSTAVVAAIQRVKNGYDQSINRTAIARYHNPHKLIRTFMTEVLNHLG